MKKKNEFKKFSILLLRIHFSRDSNIAQDFYKQSNWTDLQAMTNLLCDKQTKKSGPGYSPFIRILH